MYAKFQPNGVQMKLTKLFLGFAFLGFLLFTSCTEEPVTGSKSSTILQINSKYSTREILTLRLEHGQFQEQK